MGHWGSPFKPTKRLPQEDLGLMRRDLSVDQQPHFDFISCILALSKAMAFDGTVFENPMRQCATTLDGPASGLPGK